jgi:hypothetical protein
VIPVFERSRIIDIIAVAHVWGAVTGHGKFIGTFADPLIVHRTPISWIASDSGILPLAKSFYPTMQFAHSIVAEDANHAEQIAELAFTAPAIQFGLDVNAAEQAARAKISFA